MFGREGHQELNGHIGAAIGVELARFVRHFGGWQTSELSSKHRIEGGARLCHPQLPDQKLTTSTPSRIVIREDTPTVHSPGAHPHPHPQQDWGLSTALYCAAQSAWIWSRGTGTTHPFPRPRVRDHFWRPRFTPECSILVAQFATAWFRGRYRSYRDPRADYHINVLSLVHRANT